MKKTILAMSLIFSLGSQAFADTGSKITFVNKTNKNMVYVVDGGSVNKPYLIKPSQNSIYTTKHDTDPTFLVAGCNKIKLTECTDHTALKNCVGNKRYVSENVLSVTIKDLNSCKVDCKPNKNCVR